MVRPGMTKRSPSTKSSNQRCSLTMRCPAGSNSVMPDSCEISVHPYRTDVVAAIHSSPSFRGASKASEPGIHHHDREHGFRAWSFGPTRNDAGGNFGLTQAAPHGEEALLRRLEP